MPKYEDPVAEFKRRAEAAGHGWSIWRGRLPWKYIAYINKPVRGRFRGRGESAEEACQSALDRLDEAQAGSAKAGGDR